MAIEDLSQKETRKTPPKGAIEYCSMSREDRMALAEELEENAMAIREENSRRALKALLNAKI